ncbi:MAG: hypothetical protein RIB84_26060 [Sneathiellaceae bacterium]
MAIFFGFAPWILFYVLVHPLGAVAAAALAALVALALGVPALRRGRPKILDIGTILFFAAFALVFAAGPPPWLHAWMKAIADGGLAAIVLVSLALGRPFTIQYAKETVPEEHWGSPLFYRVNLHITLVWLAAFLVNTASAAASTLIPQEPGWLAWAIPMLSFIAAFRFTTWYPDRMAAKGSAPG